MYDITGLNYTPLNNTEWFAKSIFGGDLVSRGKILTLENVKESADLNIFDLTGKILQKDDRNCAWTPEQIIYLKNKRVEVITYKINEEQCIDALETKNTVWLLSKGAKNTELPQDLEGITMERIAQQTSEEVETLIFGGDASNADEFDGVVQTLTKSTASLKLQGVTITTTNVLSEIEKLYLSIPLAVRKSGKKEGTLCIYVSYDVYEYITIALASVNGSNVVINPSFTIQNEDVKYLGVDIIPVLGLDTNEMVASKWTNLVLVTDLVSDIHNIRLGQFPAPYDSKIFIDGRLRLGAGVILESEAVLYSPDVTTNIPAVEPATAPIVAPLSITEPPQAVGFDGVSLIVDGIDQTPKNKLKAVGDIVAQIEVCEYIEDIESIMYTEAHTLRNSPTVKEKGEAKIQELLKEKGGNDGVQANE